MGFQSSRMVRRVIVRVPAMAPKRRPWTERMLLVKRLEVPAPRSGKVSNSQKVSAYLHTKAKRGGQKGRLLFSSMVAKTL